MARALIGSGVRHRWAAAAAAAAIPTRVALSTRSARGACRCSPAASPRLTAFAVACSKIQTDAKPENLPHVKDGDDKTEAWKIKMLYDGDCPLCMREVDMLKERNKSYGAIKFVDISSEDYSPDENAGVDYETAMGRIHAILSDGTIVTDVEAFRRLYEEVGLGWVYAVTKYKPVATVADAVYSLWAKYRLQITGRPPLDEVVKSRRSNKVCKDEQACRM